jgi:hypothetical protein
MYEKFLIGLTLFTFGLAAQAEVHKCKDEAGKTYFSDRGCPNGEKMRGAPGGAAHTIATKSGDDEVAQGCLELYRKEHGGAAATTRVDSYRVKWVSVRDVGARRLFEIKVGLMNAMGFWADSDQHSCLLRGDNVTFQTTPYELVN